MHYKVLSISADCKNCFSLLLQYLTEEIILLEMKTADFTLC